MITLSGKAVGGGITKGILCFYHRNEIVINKLKITNVENEYEKYSAAKKKTIDELHELYNITCRDVGKEEAEIFSIHQMILGDSQFENIVTDYIKNKHYNAAYAVARATQVFSNILGSMDYTYIRERITDVKDVSDRLLRNILNKQEDQVETLDKCIICADDLMPSETATLDKSKVVAFCTQNGSTTSHTAILSRTMNIPAIVAMRDELSEEFDGKFAAVDGYSGNLYIEPDKETLIMLEQKQDNEGRKKELLRRLKGRKNVTRDGREFSVMANASSLSDVAQALENDAGGIGLFRSEYMYISREDLPSEEFLFYNYRRVLEDMNGKPVVIRTLDIGSDKRAEYLGLPKETNPAFGLRAIRLCFERNDIFKTQLRALLRASVYGDLHILIPFVVDVSEIREVKKIIEDVKEELVDSNIQFSEDIKIGAMIETPAAVMTSDLIAPEVDFLSIGTNDLEQYSLAVDRQSRYYENITSKNHVSVLRMIKMVADNAHANGKKVGICGELAADHSFTELFLDVHIDYLSVVPAEVLSMRKMIRSISLSDRKRNRDNIQSFLKY